MLYASPSKLLRFEYDKRYKFPFEPCTECVGIDTAIGIPPHLPGCFDTGGRFLQDAYYGCFRYLVGGCHRHIQGWKTIQPHRTVLPWSSQHQYHADGAYLHPGRRFRPNGSCPATCWRPVFSWRLVLSPFRWVLRSGRSLHWLPWRWVLPPRQGCPMP